MDYIHQVRTKLIPWVSENFPNGNVVLQQDGAPAPIAKVTQDFLDRNLSFQPKMLWPPHSSDANFLDFTFWPHVKSKACRMRHSNIEALKVSVNVRWNAMSADFICTACRAFRHRIEAIIEAEGAYIRD